jgi:hypothetical protein
MTNLIEQLRKASASWIYPGEMCLEAADALAALEAEVTKLRADAERYRWLCEEVGNGKRLHIYEHNTKVRALDICVSHMQAIDAARGEK